MDVRFSEEQRALRKSVAQAMDRLRPRTVSDLADTARAAKLDDAVASAGWRELRTGDEAGAPYTSAVEPAVVAEELGRGAADTPFLGATLAAELRRIAGAEPTGDRETIALTTDLAAPSTGGRAVVFDAADAKSALLLTAADGGHRLVSVSVAGEPGGADFTRPLTAIDVAGATPVSDTVITDEQLTRWTAFGLALTCADLVGIMDGTTTLARDYAQVRSQYGAHIGSFQAVQHLLADAKVATEGSRSIALHAAWAVDALPADEALAAAAAAKAFCARAARDVCEISIQVHGGIGNTWECFAHVYLRRAFVSIDLLGGVGANLRRVQNFYGVTR